jgi:hypothetical protein
MRPPDERPPRPLDVGVRHAGCNHLARPGSRCKWCGTILPAALPPALPPRRWRRRAA